ncbi:MAG: penicillin-binding transpeptidase domain-containing protein, partial [Acidobacteriota bacterium]|nr:penicillin-binding transpeptidase domain-containing protein [Acidobacteriota bacterium]
MSGNRKKAGRGAAETWRVLWPPRRRVQAVLVLALAVAAVLSFRVRQDVRQARMDLRMAEAAIAGADFEGLAERAPQLLGVAARQAAGESRWREVADLYDEYAEHLPPALLEAAEVELGLNFDRRGRPLGSIGDDRSLTLEEDLPAGLVPPELATHLLPPALQPPGLAAAGPGAMAASTAGARALRLTIDRAWSEAVAKALGREEGAITVLELPSGAVLAAVSNRNRRSRRRARGDSVLDPREPASIAKLITTTAAMRAGLDPDEEISGMTCRGSVLMDGERLYCAAIRGRLRGLADAMASSCNVSFARLAMDVGDRALVEEYERYGFVIGGAQGEAVPRNAVGVVHEYRHPGKRLGDLSVGLEEASITPLGAAVFAATLSDGLRREPRFVLQADGLLGISPRTPVAND